MQRNVCPRNVLPGRGKRQRRSLTNVGGPVALWGDDELARAALVSALDVREGDSAQSHVHGFHSYPARMHPTTARRLIEQLSVPGSALLDPFCGSGTVLVEGRIAGRRVVGVDANPLAVELTWLKSRGTTAEERSSILTSGRSVARSADDRRKRRAGATRRYGPDDVALFDPHVLLELDGLQASLRRVEIDLVRRALGLVLSSILVKVSRQPGDSSQARTPRRLAAGFCIHLFEKKTEELTRRLAEYAALLPSRPPPAPSIRVGDARRLDAIPDGSIDLIVTSPPYPGVYDYLAHHALRLRWLGLDTERFAALELGARRHLERLSQRAAIERFTSELAAAFAAMSRVLSPDGRLATVLGDSVIQGKAVQVDQLVRRMAPSANLTVTTIGSQLRPHFHGPSARAFDRTPRREHAIVCRRRAAS